MASKMGSLWFLFLIVLFISFPGVSGAGVVQLPQTGLTTCIDSTGAVIACAGTGQDGEVQSGALWPNPRFMDNSDGTATDTVTGLMWARQAGSPTDGACIGGSLTWLAALSYITCLNGNSYLGHSDWRLPNINELESLVNIGVAKSYPWLMEQGFTNVGLTYWSSTTYTAGTGYGWKVDFDGNQVSYLSKTSQALVWPVRQ